MSDILDLIIVGGGPAGLTAAIYAARAGLRFAVLERDGWGGGQISAALKVENYPGLPGVSGADIGERIREQALSLGAEVLYGDVLALQKNGDVFTIFTDGEEFRAKTVVAAPGSVPAKLGVPGEEKNGVSYCALCDGSFYEGKTVAVVGGGDAAVEDALYLAGLCPAVTVLLRGDSFRAAPTRAALLAGQENVRVLRSVSVQSLEGADRVERIVTDTRGVLPVEGVFVAVGTRPETEWLPPEVLQNGYIAAGEDGVTALPGLFAAGDARVKPIRQIVTAVADGANAATSAAAYLKRQ